MLKCLFALAAAALLLSACSQTPPPSAQRAMVPRQMPPATVYFDTGSSTLSSQSMARIQRHSSARENADGVQDTAFVALLTIATSGRLSAATAALRGQASPKLNYHGGMLRHHDHVTVAVTDPAAAIAFSALLDFELDKDTIISGPAMDRYMGIADLEARHITLALRDAAPRPEVQLLHFLKSPVKPEGDIARIDRIAFCHICFAVSDIDALIDKARAAGVRLRNDPMVFHDRKLAFLAGPEGITVELADWK